MDDVLENLSEAWVEYLNNKFGTNVDAESVTDWQIYLFFPELSKDQVYGALAEDALWGTVKPIDGAYDALESLIRDGHQIYVVTTSHYLALATKMEEVLFRYYPFIRWNQVILTSNKQMIRGDVLIDDGIHNLVDGDYIKILMDRPYNRAYDAEAMGMYRVKTWAEILELIRSLSDRPVCVGVKA